MFSFRLNITIILNKQLKGGGIVIGGENKKNTIIPKWQLSMKAHWYPLVGFLLPNKNPTKL